MNAVLNTERLSLKPMTEEDISFIVDLETRLETHQYETGEIPTSEMAIKKCRWFIDNQKLLPAEGAVKYILRNIDTEKIGYVSLECNWEVTREWEIGYGLLSEFWGYGFAAEAVHKAISYGFEKLNIHKLMAFINSENKKSVALARRIGMVQEGHMREARLVNGNWNDEFVFTLLKKDLR